MILADAWFLEPGEGNAGRPGGLVFGKLELTPPGEGEVLVEPLYGCWEGNMTHAVNRSPIDICRARNEPRVILGNAGVVRVIEPGPGVSSISVGERALLFATDVADAFGYPVKVVGYDAPGTMGCLSTRIKVKAAQLIKLPDDTRFSMAQWAAFGVRYVTAWSNWRVAQGVFRLLVQESELPSPHVWGWGGGTTLAELELAKAAGCRAAMLSGDDRRLRMIEQSGITAIDRRRVGIPGFDSKRYQEDNDYRVQYQHAEKVFLEEVRARTAGEMVHIFIDYIGTAVYRATVKALAREGVLTTAGWKAGMELSYLRAQACINRHQYIHTHYASRREAVDAVEYGERTGWMPRIDERVYSFHEIPMLLKDFEEGRCGYFPVFSICPE